MKLPPLKCRICGRQRPEISSGVCQCGASVWERIEHEPPPGVEVEQLGQDSHAMHSVDFGCVLSAGLGGVVIGRKIAVGGQPSAGKSTVCAELAARMAANMGTAAYWLDAEQDVSLVEATFARTRSSTRQIRRIGKLPSDPDKRPLHWREALAAVPDDAAAIVIDSVQAWTDDDTSEQRELLKAIRALEPTVFAISHFTKDGRFAGSRRVRYDVDATVVVEPAAIKLTKSRWTLTPRTISRSNYRQ